MNRKYHVIATIDNDEGKLLYRVLLLMARDVSERESDWFHTLYETVPDDLVGTQCP